MFRKAAWLWRAIRNLREANDRGYDCLAAGVPKESSQFVEIFGRSLKETMESREGIAYLMASCGFKVKLEEINLQPETRWKEQTSLATSG